MEKLIMANETEIALLEMFQSKELGSCEVCKQCHKWLICRGRFPPG